MSESVSVTGSPLAVDQLLLMLLSQFTPVAWAAQGAPTNNLGNINDLAIDTVSVPGSLVIWQHHAAGWGAIGQIAMQPVALDFSSAANSENLSLIP